MSESTPQRPQTLPEYSEAALQALVGAGLADRISLGGAFGLLHYLDYRQTYDVDAWWDEGVTTDEQRLVIAAIESALSDYGEVTHRRWGDVVSIELAMAGRKVFSFQIARRSAQLASSALAPWIDVPLDSFVDLVAGKMTALVERGAPRDFRDIHALCQAGLTTPAECWALWRRRQEVAGSDADTRRGQLAVVTHLARIAQHRPLDQIADPHARAAADNVRSWFESEFLGEIDGSSSLA